MKPYQERLMQLYGTLIDWENVKNQSTQTDMTRKRKGSHHPQEPPRKCPKYEGTFLNNQQPQEVPMEVEQDLAKNTDQPPWMTC